MKPPPSTLIDKGKNKEQMHIEDDGVEIEDWD